MQISDDEFRRMNNQNVATANRVARFQMALRRVLDALGVREEKSAQIEGLARTGNDFGQFDKEIRRILAERCAAPPLMVFDPKDGMREVYPSEACQYREWHGRVAWLYNPFTGHSRSPEDIGNDPFGLLIVAPAKAAPAEGHHV
jgi:hypothetical protein